MKLLFLVWNNNLGIIQSFQTKYPFRFIKSLEVNLDNIIFNWNFQFENNVLKCHYVATFLCDVKIEVKEILP